MKRPRYIDFECPSCGCVEERFVETEDDGTPCEEMFCTAKLAKAEPGYEIYDKDGDLVCIAKMVMREIGRTLMAPLAGKDIKTNTDDANRQRERLERRQDEHWKRRGRDEAIETERAFLKKMGADGAGGVR